MLTKNNGLLDCSLEHVIELYNASEDENSDLRKHLLALASRPEITAETRKWLADELKMRAVAQTHVEESREELLKYVKWVGKLVELFDKAAKLPDGQHPDAMWYRQASDFCNQVRGLMQEQFPRTFVELEEGR